MTKLLALIALILLIPLPVLAAAPQVSLISIHGAINPVTAGYLKRNIEEAGQRGDRLLVVEMDTPGGLDTAMRDSVQAIFGSAVPVAVYVTPAGARAASAGAVIALAADVCAMAPGTNIGAAHPVSLGEKPDEVTGTKILNDAEAYVQGIAGRRGRNVELAGKMVRESISLTAEKALQERVIDLIAADRQELLGRLEGRRLVRGGKEVVLHTAGAVVVTHQMGGRERILDTVSNPDLAYILMLIGIIGIFFELAHPGVILPGVLGGISLILAFFAFQTLPVNYAGVLLILLAIILFIAEVKVASYGILSIGGVVAMVMGSLLLFPSKEPYLRLSWGVMIGSIVVFVAFIVVVVAKVLEAHRQKPMTGREGMIGEQGVADSDLAPEGRVLVRGEYWSALSAEPVAKGESVEVIALEGLRLTVRPLGARREGDPERKDA